MTLLINIIGILIIGFIIWWFWFSQPRAVKTENNNLIEIKVKDGVYQPAIIQVNINRPLTLRFIREDATPCAEVVVFPDLNMTKTLPLNTPIDIPLTLQKPGEYAFTCQMGMYRGKLIAV